MTVFFAYRYMVQQVEELVASGRTPVNIYMVLAPLLALILISSTYWFKYYCPESKRNEIISRFNAWKRGNTRGAKLWRGFHILSLFCLVISVLLRVLDLGKGGDRDGLGVSSILLCDATWGVSSVADSFAEDEDVGGQTILRPICSIIEPNLIATIVSEMNHAPSATQVTLSGILCYLVFLDASSNVVDAAHIINDKATIAKSNVIRKDGAFMLEGSGGRYFMSKPIARIVYDTLLEQCPNKIKKMDAFYLEACQKTTKALLGIE